MATAPVQAPNVPARHEDDPPEAVREMAVRALTWVQRGAQAVHHTCGRLGHRRHGIAPHPGRCLACHLDRAAGHLTRAAELAR